MESQRRGGGRIDNGLDYAAVKLVLTNAALSHVTTATNAYAAIVDPYGDSNKTPAMY